jgi:uncharacterized protein
MASCTPHQIDFRPPSTRATLAELQSLRESGQSQLVIVEGRRRQTRVQRGCQIDLAVQTRFNTVYVCEIKFCKSRVLPSVVDEVEGKLNRLKLPRHVSARPVLIHVNGVHPDVVESRFFSRIIDFGEILTD